MPSAWLTPPHASFFSADVPLDRGTASLLGLDARDAALPPAWQRLVVLPRDDLLRHWGSPTLLKLALFRYVRVPLCVGVARARLPCAALPGRLVGDSHTHCVFTQPFGAGAVSGARRPLLPSQRLFRQLCWRRRTAGASAAHCWRRQRRRRAPALRRRPGDPSVSACALAAVRFSEPQSRACVFFRCRYVTALLVYPPCARRSANVSSRAATGAEAAAAAAAAAAAMQASPAASADAAAAAERDELLLHIVPPPAAGLAAGA